MLVVQAHSDVTKTTEVLLKSEKHDPKRYRNKIYSFYIQGLILVLTAYNHPTSSRSRGIVSFPLSLPSLLPAQVDNAPFP